MSHRGDYFWILLLCLIWGSTWLVIKIGVAEMPVFLFAGFRLLAAVLVLVLLLRLLRIKRTLDRKSLKYNVIAAVCGYFISYGCVFYGERYISSGLAAILFATYPLNTALVAHWMLHNERLSWLSALGILIGFSGVVVIFGNETSVWVLDNDVFLGMLLILGSALSSAVAAVVVKKNLTRYNPFEVTLVQSVVGMVLFFTAGLIFERIDDFAVNGRTLFCISYLGIVGSAVAIGLYFWLLQRTEAVKLSLITYVTPITAVLLGWLILDESVEPELAAGGFLVFLGIGIVHSRNSRARIATFFRRP